MNRQSIIKMTLPVFGKNKRFWGIINKRPGNLRGMSMKKKLVLFILTGFMICLFAAGCGLGDIDLNKYLSVDFTGYNGYGRATVNFDFEKLVEGHEDKLANTTFYEMAYAAWGNLDRSESLSNGERVEFTWTIDQDALKAFEDTYDVKIRYRDTSFKVSGLTPTEDLIQVDTFQHVDVTFKGESGEASIVITDHNGLEGLTFEVDKYNGLKNGEEVKVYASFDDETMMDDGFFITVREKTYTVSGLTELVDGFDRITKDADSRMDKALRDIIVNDAKEEWTYGERGITDISLVNRVFLKRKEGYLGPGNMVCYIYRILAGDTADEKVEYYWYGCFSDLKRTGDNTDMKMEDAAMPFASLKWYMVAGDCCSTRNTDKEGALYYYKGFREEADVLNRIRERYGQEYDIEKEK